MNSNVGWYDWPNSTSMRVLLLVASTTGFLLNAAYSGALTSQLSTKPKSTRKLNDLLDMGYDFFIEPQEVFPINVHSFPVSVSKFFLQYNYGDCVMLQCDFWLLLKQWRRTKFEAIKDAEAAIDLIRKMSTEKSAFVTTGEYYFSIAKAANLTEEEACVLCTSVRAGYTPSVNTMAVSKTSELKEVLNYL